MKNTTPSGTPTFSTCRPFGRDARLAHFAHRVGQGGHLSQTLGCSPRPRSGEREPVDGRGVQAEARRGGHVLRVRFQQVGGLLLDCCCGRRAATRSSWRSKRGRVAGRGLRPLRHLSAQAREVGS